MAENVVLARVGWMESYRSAQTGEAGPIGGGKYNLKNLGWERDNFLPDADGRVYGYFAIGSGTQAIDLFRVDGVPRPSASQKTTGVCVVFVAPHPIRKDLDGPVVVCWYHDATLYREEQENAGGTRAYRVEASPASVTFVPSFQRNISIPRAKAGSPGIGQSNVYYYTRNPDGSKRDFTWITRVLSQMEQFEANTEADPVLSAQIAAERQAGFQSDTRIRRAVDAIGPGEIREVKAYAKAMQRFTDNFGQVPPDAIRRGLDDRTSPFFALFASAKEILRGIADGLGSQEIAKRLDMSRRYALRRVDGVTVECTSILETSFGAEVAL